MSNSILERRIRRNITKSHVVFEIDIQKPLYRFHVFPNQVSVVPSQMCDFNLVAQLDGGGSLEFECNI